MSQLPVNGGRRRKSHPGLLKSEEPGSRLHRGSRVTAPQFPSPGRAVKAIVGGIAFLMATAIIVPVAGGTPSGSFPRPARVALHVSAVTGTQTAAYYQRIADEMLVRIEAHTGSLRIVPVVYKASRPSANQYAVTQPILRRSPYGDDCTITVFPQTDPLERWQQEHVLAHELGHCMQSYYAGSVQSAYFRGPPWLDDGLPEWIADEVVPIPPGTSAGYPVNWLLDYDDGAGTSLGTRSKKTMGMRVRASSATSLTRSASPHCGPVSHRSWLPTARRRD